jgi:hypothetical protein
MTYAKGCLSGIAALLLAALVVALTTAFRGVSQDKAIGLAVIPAMMLESVVSPLFWLLAPAFFAVFFATGRLTNGALRGLLFWFPTLFVSSLGIGLLSWFAILMVRLKRS